MGKCNKAKHIGSFDEFCEQKKTRKIKENNEVAINVPFWKEAIDYVMNELHNIAGVNIINWDQLVRIVKDRAVILDREQKDDTILVLDHIRDILYQKYFSSSWVEGTDALGSADLGTKALVLSQLASECLQRVRTEAGLETIEEPETDSKPIASISLEQGTDDIIFYEYKHLSRQPDRNVVGFNSYSKKLNESLEDIASKNEIAAVDFVLDKLEKDAGSHRIVDIMEMVENEETTLDKYIYTLTYNYLLDKTEKLNEDILKKDPDQKIVQKQARNFLANKIVGKVMERLYKENTPKR